MYVDRNAHWKKLKHLDPVLKDGFARAPTGQKMRTIQIGLRHDAHHEPPNSMDRRISDGLSQLGTIIFFVLRTNLTYEISLRLIWPFDFGSSTDALAWSIQQMNCLYGQVNRRTSRAKTATASLVQTSKVTCECPSPSGKQEMCIAV